MEENKFKCSGDCLNCRKQPNERREQWQYCAAQFTYNSMRMIGDMQEQMKSMQGSIEELRLKIEAIQNSEANVFNPTKEDETLKSPSEMLKSPIAQEGVGAEVEPQDSII